MAWILSDAFQILGVLFVLAGVALLGATIAMLEKAREESPDGTAEVDVRLSGAAVALAGAGSALLSVGWL